MRSWIPVAVVLLALATRSGPLRADVAPVAPPDRRFVTTVVRVEGLTDVGWVLAAFEQGQTPIQTHASFEVGAAERRFRLDSRLDGAPLRLFERSAWDTWLEETQRSISEQREACFSRGEGCVHPSRFSPSYPPPEGGVDCALALRIPGDGPHDGPEEVTQRLRVIELGANTCRLEPLASPDDPRQSRGALPGCSASGGLGLLAGLSGVLFLAHASRKRRP
jgi:hypothetical protein